MLRSRVGMYILLNLSLVVLLPGILFPSAVELKWDENNDPDLAGYRLYRGIISGDYSEIIDVGNVKRYAVEDLSEGVTNFFALTAYNDVGEESDFSNECSFVPLSIRSPEAGEMVEIGSKYYVRWEGDPGIREVKLLLSTNAGRDWNDLNVKTKNDGGWAWNVPNLQSDSCLIKVKLLKNLSIYDVSDEYFSIGTERADLIGSEEQNIPKSVELVQNYPNPFNPQTTISFGIPEKNSDSTPRQVTVTVYDARGREIKKLLERELPPGYHTVLWNGRDKFGAISPSGIYFYRVIVGGRAASPRKMVLAR